MNFYTRKYFARISTLMIAITIMLSVCASLSVSAEVQSWKLGDNITCTYDDETATLTYSGTGEVAKVNNYLLKKVESVIIEDGIESIAAGAFSVFKNLKTIKLGNTITSVGASAFYNCSALEEIVLPNGLKTIEDATFSGCSSLKSITLPNGITSIGSGAFNGCRALQSIEIPDSVQSIGDLAFHYCTGLSSIVIPGNVKSIGRSAFDNCVNLSSVIIEEGVETISEDAFGSKKLSECTIKIPDSVTVMGRHAFSDFGAVILGRGITEIDSYAFSPSHGMKTIRIPDSLTSIGYAAFHGTDLETIYFEGTAEQWDAVEKGRDWYYNDSKSESRSQPNVICMGDISQDDSSSSDETESTENLEPSSNHDGETNSITSETVKSEAPANSIGEESTNNGAIWSIVILVAIIAVAAIIFVVKRK